MASCPLVWGLLFRVSLGDQTTKRTNGPLVSSVGIVLGNEKPEKKKENPQNPLPDSSSPAPLADLHVSGK